MKDEPSIAKLFLVVGVLTLIGIYSGRPWVAVMCAVIGTVFAMNWTLKTVRANCGLRTL